MRMRWIRIQSKTNEKKKTKRNQNHDRRKEWIYYKTHKIEYYDKNGATTESWKILTEIENIQHHRHHLHETTLFFHLLLRSSTLWNSRSSVISGTRAVFDVFFCCDWNLNGRQSVIGIVVDWWLLMDLCISCDLFNAVVEKFFFKCEHGENIYWQRTKTMGC